MALGRKKPGKSALFKNFVKNHSRIIKREKDKDSIDHIRYKVEVIESLLIPFMKVIEKQRPRGLDTRGFIF